MNRLTWLAPIIFITVMLGGVGIAEASGAWVTSGKQVVAVGQLAVEDVKGSMSLQAAADGLGITVDELVTLINPADRSLLTPTTLFKEIEAVVPGFELTTFRETLRAYLATRAGSPATPAAAPTPTTTAAPAASPTATHTGTPTGTGTGRRTR